MIRGDPPEGWPGTGGHGVGWAAAEGALRAAVAALTTGTWHVATATATMASAAA